MQIPVNTDQHIPAITINIITRPANGNGHGTGNGFTEATLDGDALESKAEDELQMDYSGCAGFDEHFMSVETPFPTPNRQLKRQLAPLSNQAGEYLLRYHHYSTMHHSIRRMPVVSAINIDGNPAKRRDTSERKDKWLRDNRIDFAVQLTDAYYKNSHFDKGHMTRREDANWGRTPEEAKRNADFTCMYTNACPQAPAINRAIHGYDGLWGALEQIILEEGVLAEQGRQAKICVYNGPVFVATDPVFKGVQTPLRFFKIVVWLNDAGKPQTTAFILSQEDLVSDIEFEELQYNQAFIDHQCSVAYLEKLTGLYFRGVRDWDTFRSDGPGSKQVKRLHQGDLESLVHQQSAGAGKVMAMPKTESTGIAARYRAILKDGVAGAGKVVMESAGGLTAATVAAGDRQNILEQARESLYKMIERYLGKSQGLKDLADKILQEGGEALKAVAEDDDAHLHGMRKDALEVIVHQDGSRPSFLIRNGVVDKDSSPIGSWSGILDASMPALKDAIDCVGRIDVNGRHVGTGFLVGPDVIITNRHVLQAIGVENNGGWTLYPGTTIDFGFEFQGTQSMNRRNLQQVVFCGDQPIDGALDHAKLDLSLISLSPLTHAATPVTPLMLMRNTGWVQTDTQIYTVGYPGNPGPDGRSTYGSLLEQLFRSTFGYKRLAPGRLLPFGIPGSPGWTLAHEATTLGGNSGSPVLVFGSERAAAGLHYGGTLATPRQNWGHILGKTLGAVNSQFCSKTLEAHLSEHGVLFS